MNKTIFLSFLLGFLVVSCLSEPDLNIKASMTSDIPEVISPAAVLPDGSGLSVTVRIISNCSWFAHLNDLDNPVNPSKNEPMEWGSISISDHSNYGRIVDTTDVVVNFVRNLTQLPKNGVLNFYASGDLVLSIPVTQSGAVYHLSAASDRTKFSCVADTAFVSIDCNTVWTARVDGSSTADVFLDAETGFDPSVLKVVLRDNVDVSTAKTARIIISAESCADVVLDFVQDKAVPYLQLVSEKEKVLETGVLASSLTFRTNCNWTVEVSDGSTFKNIIFDKASGGAQSGDITVNFTFENGGDDPHLIDSMDLIVKSDLCESPLTVNYSQRCPLHLDFYTKNPKWTTSEPVPYGLPVAKSQVGSINVPTSYGSYSIDYNNSLFRNKTDGSHGLQVTQNGYFGLPGITGMKLVGVVCYFKYHSSFKKLRLKLMDYEDKTMLYSGMLQNYAITADWVHTFYTGEITEPEVKSGNGPVDIGNGKGCWLMCDANNNNLIIKMDIIYKPVE